jgi:hypothetical protein
MQLIHERADNIFASTICCLISLIPIAFTALASFLIKRFLIINRTYFIFLEYDAFEIGFQSSMPNRAVHCIKC